MKGLRKCCLVVLCGQFLLQQFKFLVFCQQPVPGCLLQVLVVFCVLPATNIPCSGYLCGFCSSKWSQIFFSHPRSLHPGRLCHSPSPNLQVWHLTPRAAPAAPCWWYLSIPTAGWVWRTAPNQTPWKYPTAGWHQRRKATVCAPLWEVWSAGQFSC